MEEGNQAATWECGGFKAAGSERAKPGKSDSQNVQDRLANGAGLARRHQR
jgi:hypothetical protein